MISTFYERDSATFILLTPQNGQTHLSNSSATANKLFECV